MSHEASRLWMLLNAALEKAESRGRATVPLSLSLTQDLLAFVGTKVPLAAGQHRKSPKGKKAHIVKRVGTTWCDAWCGVLGFNTDLLVNLSVPTCKSCMRLEACKPIPIVTGR